MAVRFEIRPATDADADALQTLVNSTPQPGSIEMNFERSPVFFHGSQVATSAVDVWVMEDHQEKRLAGVFSIGSREVFVNGERKRVRYGNDLRIHPAYQGGRALFRMFKKYREIMQEDWMQTVILSENENSLSTVGSGRAGLPTYYEFGQMKTNMVYLNKRLYKHGSKQTNAILVRRATPEDLHILQTFVDSEASKRQFFPCYDFQRLVEGDPYYRGLALSDYFLAFEGSELKGRELVGVTGVWDQKSFKQTRFLAYHGPMKFLRHVNNLQSRIFGGMQLPQAGGVLNYLMMHCVLVKGNDPTIFQSLFNAIYQAYMRSSYTALVCGLSIDDPLNSVLDRYRRQELLSKHFVASYANDPRDQFDGHRQLYLEAARL